MRILVDEPDSPIALRIMSNVRQAIAPSAKATDQIIAAMQARLLQDGPAQRAAVDAAITHWEWVVDSRINNEVLGDFEKAAMARAAQELRRPPEMVTILSSVADTTDVGFQLGVHQHGLRGTWARLWDLLMDRKSSHGAALPDGDVVAVRTQLEGLLERPLKPDEWNRLTEAAEQRRNASPPSTQNPR